MNFDNINTLIFRFDNLGIEKHSNGTVLIGKAPHVGQKAWLNII
jgi:hypothetical protein